ncbi:MAG: PAS domain-containing protein, partial [bacterium]
LGKGNHAYTVPFYGEARPNMMDLVLENREDTITRYPNVTRAGDTLMGEVYCKALYDNKGAWVFAKASPLRDDSGDITGVIESIRDITELKRVELELQDANQCSEQIINSAQEGVIVYDRNLRYRIWNPFMEQISGMTADEVLGKHPSELFPFVEASGLTERLEKVLAGDMPTTIDFPYAVPKTGKSGWNSDLSVPLRDTDGEIIGVIATIRETTWRRQVLDELHHALEETRNANTTMSRLLRTIAHEFRTPLGLLTGSTDILDRYWDRLTPEKRSEQNANIRNAALNNRGQSQGESPIDEGKMMTAEACAKHILRAIEKRKRTLVLTFTGKRTVFMNKFFPRWADKLVKNFFFKNGELVR